MRNKAIVKIEKNLPVNTGNSPADLIRSAVAGNANLEQLKGLLELQERYEANEAKKAYHKAMAAFKANLPQIIKDKKVSYPAGGSTIKYAHATLCNIMNKISPELSKYGLSVAWVHKQEQEKIFVTTRITHELGYSEETTISAPADNSGSKNAIQAIGSTISYLERYGVLGLIGTATKDQDDDARLAGPAAVVEVVDNKQLSQLLDMTADLQLSNSDKAKFYAFMKVSKLEDIRRVDFNKAVAALEEKKRLKENK